MKIYLISQNINNDYDTYDSAVVVAKDAREARKIYPGDSTAPFIEKDKEGDSFWKYSSWVKYDSLKQVKVKCIGDTKLKKRQVICASFNAG